jgi:peroxiredoxin Q/BCP
MAPDKSEIFEGDKAPDFTLPAFRKGKEETISLKDFHGKKWVILYFYPKDNTPGCTQEACDFRDLSPQIDKRRAAVLGVSLDPLSSHQKFSSKFELPFPLLSDAEGKVSKKYGVYKLKQLYGRSFWGIERSTFVIDPNGKIVKAFRKVKVNGHAREILTLLRGGAPSPASPSNRPPQGRPGKS